MLSPFLYHCTGSTLTRRLPVAYGDGINTMAGQDRVNPFEVTWNTMRGLTGKPSFLNRTAFFVFFGRLHLYIGRSIPYEVFRNILVEEVQWVKVGGPKKL